MQHWGVGEFGTQMSHMGDVRVNPTLSYCKGDDVGINYQEVGKT